VVGRRLLPASKGALDRVHRGNRCHHPGIPCLVILIDTSQRERELIRRGEKQIGVVARVPKISGNKQEACMRDRALVSSRERVEHPHST
jgi:hypothetical protein